MGLSECGHSLSANQFVGHTRASDGPVVGNGVDAVLFSFAPTDRSAHAIEMACWAWGFWV